MRIFVYEDDIGNIENIESILNGKNLEMDFKEQLAQHNYEDSLLALAEMKIDELIVFIDLTLEVGDDTQNWLQSRNKDWLEKHNSKHMNSNQIRQNHLAGLSIFLEIIKNKNIQNSTISLVTSNASAVPAYFRALKKSLQEELESQLKLTPGRQATALFWGMIDQKDTAQEAVEEALIAYNALTPPLPVNQFHDDTIIEDAIKFYESITKTENLHDELQNSDSTQSQRIEQWLDMELCETSKKALFLKQNNPFGLSGEAFRESMEIEKTVFLSLLIKLEIIENADNCVFMEGNPYMRIPYAPLFKWLVALKSYLYRREYANEKFLKVEFRQLEKNNVGVGIISLHYEPPTGKPFFGQRYNNIAGHPGFNNIRDQHTSSKDLWDIIHGVTIDLKREDETFGERALWPLVTPEFGYSCVNLLWTYYEPQTGA